MKFLVILIALLINHYWTRDRALPGDGWFESLLGHLKKLSKRFEEQDNQHLTAIAVLLLPSCILLILLWIVGGVWFGLISFSIHVALLLVLFDPVHLRSWTQRYLTHWREEDFEGAYLYLQERASGSRLENGEDQEAVHEQCSRFLLANSFERLFAVLFWYLVLGPAGALAFYALGQMQKPRYPSALEFDQPWLARLEFVLEWVPARLLGLTFALAGQFESTFNCLRRYFFYTAKSAQELVIRCAYAAIGKKQRSLLVRDTEGERGSSSLVIDFEGEDEVISTEQYAQQIEDILSLLDRSQIIWVSALALLAVYGIGG